MPRDRNLIADRHSSHTTFLHFYTQNTLQKLKVLSHIFQLNMDGKVTNKRKVMYAFVLLRAYLSWQVKPVAQDCQIIEIFFYRNIVSRNVTCDEGMTGIIFCSHHIWVKNLKLQTTVDLFDRKVTMTQNRLFSILCPLVEKM